jgi:hypothetical protein
MKRVLVSQNEKNNGKDYLIVDGKLLTDDKNVIKYGRIISKTDEWEEIYRDDYLEIRKNENQLLLKSFYNDKDIVGRSIYYLYMVDEEFDNIDSILGYLEQDSQLINRTYDRERTQDIVGKIKNSDEIKGKLIKYMAIALGAILLGYLLTRIKL